MIRYQAKTAADALLMNCSDADAPRFAGELYSTAYTGFYANTIMVAAYWAFAALALALGIWLDHRRNFACKNKPAEVAWQAPSTAMRCMLF